MTQATDPWTPASGRSVHARVNGLTMHYLDFGHIGGAADVAPADDPRPVLLQLHGGAAHAHWFDFVSATLAERFRVLSLDLRGHGDSEAAPDGDYGYFTHAHDVARFVEELGRGAVTLTGHSMGGMVSLVTAARHPAAVARLVVIDSMMQLSPDRASTMRGFGAGPGRSFQTRDEFVAGFKIRPGGSSAPAPAVRHVAEHACRQHADGQWRAKFDRAVYQTRDPINGFEHWRAVRAPALVVAGGRSDRITNEVAGGIRAACAHIRFATVANAGHHVVLDEPAGYCAALNEFLEL